MFLIDHGSIWMTDAFNVHDEARFLQWIDYWPEADAVRAPDGRWVVVPSSEIIHEGYYNDDPWVQLPVWLCDPQSPPPEYMEDWEDVEVWKNAWYLPEEAGGVRDETIFLFELSNHVADRESCVLRMLWNDYGYLGGKAWALVGGSGSPESRVASVDLDEAYGRGADLEGGRLMLSYYEDAA
ncbi:hypothetical protein [Ruegeria arenilitoris]|uniref:hypothetical protein n=1 Tax=Ruegeria arenilitoris TaxID=1173585 RepID=UPI001479B32B|nr:hypothetical protein [Ruegeria arenilitoris]